MRNVGAKLLKGSFDKFAESTKKKRGTAEVDDAFLEEIESWRKEIARNFAKQNAGLSARELNSAVQRTIDRIVFLRICEDRGIENYGQLLGITNGTKVYSKLGELFRKADDKYNSGLFHFTGEKNRGEPDEWTLSLNLDDKILKKLIKGLYYPESPYEFSVLSADILGQVYEQFLGKVIRLTKKHQARVEDKPEVKKAGGVYYTPTYVVDFIVEQTLKPLLKGKEAHEAAGRTKSTWKPAKGQRALKVLDPSCGSGSFLIGAYDFLLKWYRNFYIDAGPKKFKDRIYESRKNDWRLTTAERKRILLDHIFGVDIDAQAVEVTKLSLLLKVLEGENQESLERQMRLFRERALPDLAANIKCGNSLIAPDFFFNEQSRLFDEEQTLRINAFDWQTEFKEIVSQGFDAIIGNPPWGAEFDERELNYHRTKNQEVIVRMIDSFMYFTYQFLKKISPKTGRFGMILPDVVG
jgi:type I restriction-modification system DNA methylase subunit